MNWEAIGAVGEVGGAIAVVATLAYLAKQIQESNRVTNAEAVRSRAEMMVNTWFRVVEDDRLYSATKAAYFDGLTLEEMNETDRVSFRMLIRGLTARWESEYFENRHRVLSDTVWAQRLQTIAAMLERPAYHEGWCEVRPALTTEFVATIERELERKKTDSSS